MERSTKRSRKLDGETVWRVLLKLSPRRVELGLRQDGGFRRHRRAVEAALRQLFSVLSSVCAASAIVYVGLKHSSANSFAFACMCVQTPTIHEEAGFCLIFCCRGQ